jgi:DNA repair exonuclease SbcCD ATPase subunit
MRKDMAEQERLYDIKKHGNLLLQEVEQRLLRKVQPRTEYYMQQILPLLTGGRYHDVHLTTEAEEGTLSGGSFQIQVWDAAAGEYLPTSALSGGAADQLSLALRLAFAIATLPRDLNSAPGFVLLDEPLSSFDRGRAQALVDVVTGDVLSRHFEQIILLSHSGAFDPAMFPYHLYMDNGLIIESNLPVVQSTLSVTPISQPSMPATPFPDGFDEDEDEDTTVAIAAIKLPFEKL